MDNVAYGQPASGYGYNGRYLSRALGVDWPEPTYIPELSRKPLTRRFRDLTSITQTVAFADAAQVRFVPFVPPIFSFEETWLLEPPSRNFPSVHFRHSDSANVAFMDGSVRTFGYASVIDETVTFPPPAAQVARMEEERLGYVSNGDLTDPVTRDELYDRD